MDKKQEMQNLKDDIEKAVNDVLEKEIEIRCCHYLDVTMTKIENAEKVLNPSSDPAQAKVNVEFENGKIHLLDFWASWCPPC